MSGLTSAIARCIAIRLRWKLDVELSDDEWAVFTDEAYPPGEFGVAVQEALEDQMWTDIDRLRQYRRVAGA